MPEREILNMELYLQVQNFLFEEAALIDSWKLDEWLQLFAEETEYQVPPTDLSEGVTPENSLFYIADDRRRLEERVLRLGKKTAHSEWPRSKVRHLVSNVRLLDVSGETVSVAAAFVCYRCKDGVTDTFMGHYEYQLERTASSFKIRRKRCQLDMDGLRPHGRISIIL
ncbi:MAG: aromatic-ring-hydroxylating dioxygenase subunit beta [Gammaproteobacteria bacterium]|nr:aromatic-ring-hydroxylating dioxygenase subunit beta [Gammaproteobacteria bacterium]